MRPPQHCAHAIEGLRLLREAIRIRALPISEDNVNAAIADITNAAKFMLPEDGRLLHADQARVQQWLGEFTRLPFPITALEFDAPTALPAANGSIADAAVVVARQEPGADEILVLTCIRWRQHPGDRATWIPADEVCYNPRTGDFAGALKEPGTLGQAFDDDCISAAAITALGEFLAALACSNVEVQTAPGTEKRHWMQSRRERALPHFTYKVLTIDTPANRTGAHGTGQGDGTHASPRLHLRRGHIRRYPSGKLAWVNAHMVGSAEAGTIAKDYRVRNRAQESTR